MTYIACPECGAETSPTPHCWLCGCPLLEHGNQTKPGAAASFTRTASAGPPIRLQFGIASLLLTITLIAVLLGVMKLVPGLGLLLILFISPAFLRATVLATRRKAVGERMTLRQKLVAFSGSLGLIAALLMALGCTYLTSCAVGAVGNALGILDDDVAIIGSNTVGVLGQLAYTIFFIRWLWVQRADQRNRPGDVGFVLSWCGFALINTMMMFRLAKNPFFDQDLAGFGFVAVPGVVICLFAIRRPHRSLASCGLGLGIAACVATLIYLLFGPSFAPRNRTPASESVLMTLLVGNVLSAAAISAAVYYVARWREREP